MKIKFPICVIICTISLSAVMLAEEKPKEKKAAQIKIRPALKVLETTEINVAGQIGFGGQPQCDADGDVYMRSMPGGPFLQLNKIDTHDKKVTKYDPNKMGEGGEWWPGGTFYVSPSGEVTTVTTNMSKEERKKGRPPLYLIRYDKNGDIDSREKLEDRVTMNLIAPFANGDFLVSGRKVQPDGTERAYTAVISKTGTVLHKFELDEDRELNKVLVDYDPVKGDPMNAPTKALDMSRMEAGDDGLVYLMRESQPYTVLAIASDGTVVRRIKADPPEEGYSPRNMHIAGGRLAILYGYNRPGKPQILRLIEAITGDEFAAYETDNDNGSFSCYLPNERFVFLRSKDKKVTLKTLTP